ncbi:hypothetical protein IW492_02430 [Enterococcus sp. BWB1-3]|uniref:hypothetical protein n=1 Tax=unclassified Enterococcus TaxID=2608891 RepID=UPI0019208976|nr:MULTISPECIES: hypothetical protein [unclassified Enterococcus]MBL1228088.1 hypothetical protein [Enterococcus sp. BWB1-3]MCB5951913.1 hypothetical protein [Enterococcus sp. BWT-B8]MCB5954109.1 hypothetical protein [Enterococcus sp. CWB-B31]
MRQRIIQTALLTIIYLLVANIGNIFFRVDRTINWTTTLWEALFFAIFIFLFLGYRDKK